MRILHYIHVDIDLARNSVRFWAVMQVTSGAGTTPTIAAYANPQSICHCTACGPSAAALATKAYAELIRFGTLVLQGSTLVPLIRVLSIEKDDSLHHELSRARTDLIRVALESIGAEHGKRQKRFERHPAKRRPPWKTMCHLKRERSSMPCVVDDASRPIALR